jgi:hypothetical protein
MKRRLKAPSPALVIALIALFIALGGTSYAAIKLPKNSVGSKQLKNNAVTGSKIKNGAVTKSKINTSGLTVPNATHATTADSATSATTATSATSATSAASATTAANATNAAALNGFTASQLARATTASLGSTTDPCSSGVSGFGDFETTTFTNLITKSVTAPVSGVLLIIGNTSSEFSDGSGAGPIRLLSHLAVDGTVAGVSGEATLSDNGVNCDEGRTTTLATAVPVTAGSHTVALQIAKSATTAGAGGAFIGGVAITTLFVPFGNAGTQGVLGLTHDASHAGTSNR